MSTEPTKGDLLKARQRADEVRIADAGAWVAKALPDLAGCSFAIAVALQVRSERPDVKAGELARVVRVQREVWMRRCGAWDETQDERDVAA